MDLLSMAIEDMNEEQKALYLFTVEMMSIMSFLVADTRKHMPIAVSTMPVVTQVTPSLHAVRYHADVYVYQNVGEGKGSKMVEQHTFNSVANAARFCDSDKMALRAHYATK